MNIPYRNIYFWAIIAVLLFLCINAGSRKMFRRYWDIKRLTNELVQLRKENALLKNEIYLLEEDPSYIERIARRELGLISPDEVEYRFDKDK